MNAAARVPSASITPPSRVASIAINAPSAAATSAPNSAAHRKLIWPCVEIPGMFMPVCHVNAQPAAKPPAVTNVGLREADHAADAR